MHSIFRSLRTNSITHPINMLLAYKAYFRPALEYSTTMFGPKHKQEIAKLEFVQNSFTRKLWLRVHGCDYTTIPLAAGWNKMFNLQSLACRRRRYDLITVYQLLNGVLGRRLRDFYSLSPSSTRGCQGNIQIPKARTNLAIRSTFFTRKAGSEFLKFPKKIVMPNSLRQCKGHIDRYLQEAS